MQSSSEQPLVEEERYVTTLITAAKETSEASERVPNRVLQSRHPDGIFP